MAPMTHIVTLVSLSINLLTKSPDAPSTVIFAFLQCRSLRLRDDGDHIGYRGEWKKTWRLLINPNGGYVGNNGKEHGNYYNNGLYRGYMEIMEKIKDTTYLGIISRSL